MRTDDWNFPDLSGLVVAAVTYATGDYEHDTPDGWVEIRFDDGRILRGDPDADCCAHAWVDEVAGIGPGVGGVMEGIKTAFYTSEETDDWDVRDTFVEVITISGHDVAALCRCRHNGYYSGWLDWSWITR